jgi:magnesium chelatase family protein
MTSSSVSSVAFCGVEVMGVDVQTHIGNGMPSLVIVGLIDKAVSEAKERVRVAMASLGLSMPPKRIVVNLAPANIFKEGSHFDLAIALSILGQMQIFPPEALDGFVVMGELALDGTIASSRGVLPAAIYAVENKKKIICSVRNAQECAMLQSGLEIVCPRTLLDIVNHLGGKELCQRPDFDQLPKDELVSHAHFNMSEIRGQSFAKRGMMIAASGGHNILLNGHPGTGKSMLASAFMSIVPDLNEKEVVEVSALYSLAGLLRGASFGKQRPYRSPHHSASMASIIGGGRVASLGEVTLAHRGVLFLDELPEFQRQVLDSLRQPLEEGRVTVARANYRFEYPARFQLVAAMNPCVCGYFGDPSKQCRKVPKCAMEYEGKVSGPIMDRIDLGVWIETEKIDVLFDERADVGVESSEDMKKLVDGARKIQEDRYKEDGIYNNADLSVKLIEKYCPCLLYTSDAADDM